MYQMEWVKRKIRRVLDLFGRVKLVTVYAWICMISFAIFVGAWYFSNQIAGKSIRNEYEDYNEALFDQTVSDINRGIFDLVQLSYTIMSSESLNEFLTAKNFGERNSALSGVQYEFNRLKTIRNDIEAIVLYDNEGKMVANTGITIPSELYSTVNNGSSISFSGIYHIEKNDYFQVIVPLYLVEKSVVKEKNGCCSLLVSLDFLEQRLPDVVRSGEQWCAIIDGDSQIILEKGDRPSYLPTKSQWFSMDEEADEASFLYIEKFDKAKWKILFSIPKNTVFRDINTIQRINIMTYLVTGMLIFVLFLGIYASFLRPVKRQIAFMNYYAINRKSRMKVLSDNEMGILAKNLNEMLDELDHLNDENIQASKKILEVEYQKKQSELLAYRNQINPHFLYNTFECIRGMALYYEVPDIAAISESLASFFTYNVRGKGYAQIRVICQHIEDYASIIGYRFMNQYQIVYHADEEVMECVFPKMVIQPLLENAIFHGLETIESDGIVQVEIKKKEEKLIILVADNGHGMDQTTLDAMNTRLKEYDRTNLLPIEKHGIGMVNIYRRLRLFYGENLMFSVESEIGVGTRIKICVPSEANIREDEYVSGIFN